MKNKKRIFIISAIVIFIISLVIINNLNTHSSYFKISLSSKPTWESTYKVGDFDSLVFDIDTMDLKILASNDADIHLKIYDFLKNVQYKTDNRILEIGETKTHKCHACLLLNNYIELSLPTSYVKEVSIKNHKADINLATLRGKVNIENQEGEITLNDLIDLTITNDAGNIRGKNVIINKITTQSGHITLNKAGVLDDAQITSDSGNVTVDFASPVYVDYETTSGHVKINDSSLEDNKSIFIKTNSGNITIN